MKTSKNKHSARAPNTDEVPVLDVIASEILENLVLEGKLAQLTHEKEVEYVERYKRRKPTSDCDF